MMKRILWSVLFGLLLLTAAGCRKNGVHQIQGCAFGTYYAITYCGDEIPDLTQRVDSLLSAFSAEFSTFDSLSVVSRLNRGEDVCLTQDLEIVLQQSHVVSVATCGAFDVTVAPLVDLWGFGPQDTVHVTPQAIDSAHRLVGYRKISVKNHHLVKENEKMQLNFNAIAKGYAVDKVSIWMKKLGYENCLVDIGGEVRSMGSKYGKSWRIGIQVPTEDKNGLVESDYNFEMKDAAIATSGNYRNYHEVNGERFSHIINPQTGYSENSDLLSVSIMAKDCIVADAYATACMVLGVEKSLKMLKAHPELAAYFIYYKNGKFKVAKTPNFP